MTVTELGTHSEAQIKNIHDIVLLVVTVLSRDTMMERLSCDLHAVETFSNWRLQGLLLLNAQLGLL